jgi:predicted Zn-dependent protease
LTTGQHSIGLLQNQFIMAIYNRNQPSVQPGAGARFRMPGKRNTRGGILIALLLATFALCKYYSNSQFNEVTGETQHVSISPDQEIALGLHSLPSMIEQYGGLHPDAEAQQFVKRIGNRIVQNSDVRQTPYQYDFHLLNHPDVVNAFALPGGQVFITLALFNKLETEDQLAGIFGHEVGHVVARHGAERIAKQELTDGLTGAAVVASGDYNTAQAAQMIANVVNMSYGRDQELQSDDLGVRFMIQAGYDPEALIGVMNILEEASGGQRQPEFLSTHPSPENRVQRIREAIAKYQNQ